MILIMSALDTEVEADFGDVTEEEKAGGPCRWRVSGTALLAAPSARDVAHIKEANFD